MDIEIKRVAATDIRYMNTGSYQTLYSSICKCLGVNNSKLFAPIAISGKIVKWVTPKGVNATFKSIVDAPRQDAGLLRLLWEQQKNEILSIIRKKNATASLENIVCVPKDDFIFYTEVPGAENDVPQRRFRLLVTGWACEVGSPVDPGKDVGKNEVVEAENCHQLVNVLLLDEKQNPLTNTDFVYIVSQKCSNFTSDSNGMYNMGPCLVGTSLIFRYPVTNQEQNIVVRKNVGEYRIVFASKISAHFAIKDQKGNCIPDVGLNVSYANQDWSLCTDGLGEISIDDILYQGENVLVHVSLSEYGVSKDFRVSLDSASNKYQIIVEIAEPLKVYLRVIQNHQPLTSYSIQVACGSDSRIMATDDNGIIQLPYINIGDIFTATSTSDPESTETFSVVEGQEEYLLVVKEEQPLPPPVMPTPYLIVKVNGTVTPGYKVLVESAKGKAELVTDENGKISLDNLLVNDFFVASSLSNQSQRNSYTIQPDIYEYPFEIIEEVAPKNYHLVVKVNDMVTPQYEVQISSSGVVVNAVSNNIGEIPLDKISVGSFFLVASVSNPNCSATYTLEESQEEYVFNVDAQTQPEYDDKYIKVIDATGNAVPFYSFDITHNKVTETVLSDANGNKPIPSEWKDGDFMELRDEKTTSYCSHLIIPSQIEYPFTLNAIVQKQKVVVRVINENGGICPQYPLAIQINEETLSVNTDTNGIYDLGEVSVGTKFVVADGNNTTYMQEYEVVQDKDEYVFQIKSNPENIIVQLLNKDDKPVPNAQLTLTNQRGENFSHYTNDEGCIEVPNAYFTNGETISVQPIVENMKVKKCTFKYTDEYNHYIVKLKEPFPWGCLWRLLLLLLLLALLFVRCERNIDIQTVDIMGNSIPSATVEMQYTEHQLFKNGEFLYETDHTLNGVTDNEGMVTFEKLPCSLFSWVFYTLSKAHVEGVKDLSTGSGDFFFHWQLLTYELVLKQPNLTELVFRTVDADTGELLPECTLIINTTTSGSTTSTSGNGEFKVGNLQADEEISIVASKQDYGTNSTKILNAKVVELKNASQERRDIPLSVELAPCNASSQGKDGVEAGSVSQPQSYNMGVNSGTFDIYYETGIACSDCIDIYNHKPGEDPLSGVRVFSTGQVVTDGVKSARVPFSNGSVITIIVTTGPKDGSVWQYKVNCPN